MKKEILWSKDYKIKNYDTNIIDKDTDILIIGAGITGLTTSYYLKDLNKKITLIDKDKIGFNVTYKTTGKISYIQKNIYSKLVNSFNKSVSKLYFDSQRDATNIIKNIITTHNINCNLEKVSSIVFTLEDKNIKKIEEEKNILSSFGVNVVDINDSRVKRAISVDDTYIFNPVKYINGLVKELDNNINIYENTIATNINLVDNKYLVTTNKGVISTKILIVACHYPFFIVPTFIPLKTYIKREYVNASKFKNDNFTAINIDDNLHSIRFYNNYIIYGSNKHKLTNKIDYKRNYDNSKKDFIKYFSKEPEYTWMNQDIVSNDLLPFIGEVKNNLFLATAFNGWGMTCGTIAGQIISDLIIYKKSKYKELFSPNRNNINLIMYSLIGSFSYLKSYLVSVFKKNNPEYITIKGINYGVYTDDLGIRHFIKIVCPHMKCHLVFNKEEKTWDCPCHGSRFDIDGNLIEGPAKENINSIIK